MNSREKTILKMDEDFRDTIENDLLARQEKSENKKVEISDVKYVGEITWKDKINGKDVKGNVFIVDKRTTEIDENGIEHESTQQLYYLNDKCIGGDLGNGEVVYKESFKNAEPDKLNSVQNLLETVSQEEIENNSMKMLQTKELAEVLSVQYGRKVSFEETQKLMENMSKDDIKELEENAETSNKKADKKTKSEEDKELSKKQTEKITVNGIQKVDLNKKVDGMETLGARLDLNGFTDMYVIYSDKVDDIKKGTNRNTTTYSLVGVRKDGTAKVLNDEFEMDRTTGNTGGRLSTKIRADGTASRDNNDISTYVRKSNGMSVGIENDQGHLNMFMYQKTKEENENVGIQIETSQTQVIPIESKRIMNRNQGAYQGDKVQDEIQEHTDNNCTPDNARDYDGNEQTESHEHDDGVKIESGEKIDVDKYVEQILNYTNEYGEQKINDVFTENEVREKLERELESKPENIEIEDVVKNVEQEMNSDAENLDRSRDIDNH